MGALPIARGRPGYGAVLSLMTRRPSRLACAFIGHGVPTVSPSGEIKSFAFFRRHPMDAQAQHLLKTSPPAARSNEVRANRRVAPASHHQNHVPLSSVEYGQLRDPVDGQPPNGRGGPQIHLQLHTPGTCSVLGSPQSRC